MQIIGGSAWESNPYLRIRRHLYFHFIAFAHKVIDHYSPQISNTPTIFLLWGRAMLILCNQIKKIEKLPLFCP